MAFVADNSVIVGWFIPSQASELTRKALRLSRRERVHVPALWQSEFANVLVGLERRGLITGHQVDAIVAKAERFGLEIHDAFPSISPLIGLMRARGIKAYDASYLHLAASLNVPLYTRDGSLRAAARSAGLTAP
ncbi:MAG: type II toxin-antitoxin system VapC family toxin [Betaproteobacteria bacterium]|nr:type II toxin-antitoxin system VapC family toxin [Betaproteobacteria bacterium]